jgi:hypothetical protein
MLIYVFRTVAELSQEVADIVEERVVLEYQLDQLKSFGSQVSQTRREIITVRGQSYVSRLPKY